MSRTVENRVVEMEFVNQQFEQGVAQSLTSLDRLKKGLDLSSASKGLTDLDVAGKNFSLAGVAEGVDSIASKFTTLGIMGVTAIMNITNSLMDMGTKLVKSLTLDNITAGFSKYEMKTQAIQTIIAATEKPIEEVNKSLEKLVWFTDETSYNLIDMTSNIGKFTSNGIELDASVTAMQGIANAAALSGSGIQNASHAMQGFSKAMAQGSMTRINWNWIKTARMDTKQFKESMIEAGIAAGTLTKAGDKVSTSIKGTTVSFMDFETAMSEGWMTTEVMIKALSGYGGFTDKLYEATQKTGLTASVLLEAVSDYKAGTIDLSTISKESGVTVTDLTAIFAELGDETLALGQKALRAAQEAKTFTEALDSVKDAVSSGWMTSFETIFGDYEEAKVLWTNVANTLWDVFASGAESRNEMLKAWKDLGGRDDLMESFANVFHTLDSLVSPITEAFRDFFPPVAAEQLYSFTAGLKSFTDKLKMGEEATDKLKRTFSGVFAVFDLGAKGITAVVDIFNHALKLVWGPTTTGILDVTSSIGDFLVKINETVESSGIFVDTIEKIKNTITTVADRVRDAVNRITIAFGGFKKIDLSGMTGVIDATEKKFRPFAIFSTVISKSFEAIVSALVWAAPLISKLGSIASDALSKFASMIGTAIKELNFTSIFDLLNAGIFTTILLGIKKFTDSLKSVKGTVEKALGFKDGIMSVLDSVRGALESYQKSLKADTLKTIAISIAILAGALLLLSMIPADKLMSSVVGITALFTELSIAMLVLTKSMANGKVISASVMMIAMSTAIVILSAALKNLSTLDWGQVAVGTVGVGALTAMLVASAKLLSTNKRVIAKGTVGLIAFSTAVLILAQALIPISKMQWGELAVGLTGMGAMMLGLAGAIRLMGSPERMVSTGIGLIGMATAMLIFSEAIKRMGSLAWDEIGRGLTTMAASLAAIVISMNLLPKNMVSKATALVIIGGALLIVASAVKSFAGMRWDEIERGLVAFGGSLLILTASLVAMKSGLPGAAAMLIVAPALLIFAKVLKTLGGMSLSEVGISLLTLAGAFTVLGLAGLVLSPLIPTLAALAGVIAVMGIGIALTGTGILALSAGLTALSVSAVAIAGSVVVIFSSLLSLIPLFFTKIGEGILAFSGVIINGAPIVKDAFLVLLASAIEAIVETIPMLSSGMSRLLIGILDSLTQYMPEIIDKLSTLLITLFEKAADKLPAVIIAGSKFLKAMMDGIFAAIGEYRPESLMTLIACFTLLVAAFAILANSKKYAMKAIVAAGALAVVMGIISGIFMLISFLDLGSTLDLALSISSVLLAMSVSIAILGGLPLPMALSAVASLAIFVAGLSAILLALGALSQIPGFDWILGEGARVLGMLGSAIGGFVGNIIGGVMTGVSGTFVKIGEDLSAFMEAVTPFIEGTKKIDASSMNGVKALAETVLILTASGVVNGLTSWFTGGSSMTKFGKELAEFGPHYLRYYESIKGINGSVVESSASAASSLAAFAANLPKQGGLVASITGANSITKFAEELTKFGPALTEYSKSIGSMDSDAVVKSADAAKIITDMATNLPKQGGLSGWLTGSNTLSAFANELSKFGPGLQLYSQSLQTIDVDKMSRTTIELRKLVELAKEISSAESGGLSMLGASLAALGQSGLDGFIGSFTANDAQIRAAAVTMITNFINAANSKKDELISAFHSLGDVAVKVLTDKQFTFYAAGTTFVSQLASGATNQAILAKAAFSDILVRFLDAVKVKTPEFMAAGKSLIVFLITGIRLKESEFISAATAMTSKAVEAIKKYYSNFEDAGKYLVEGFASGIDQNTYKAEAKARAMASAAARAAEKALGIHSPSRVGYGIGGYFGKGFIMAISDYASKSYVASQEMANQAKDGLNRAIATLSTSLSDEMDAQPTIRPVLDLSEVRDGFSTLSSWFNHRQALTISSAMSSKINPVPQNGSESSGSNFSFVQNNYSPKPLSRLEIYRQTNNQLSTMKGLVNA